MSMSNALDFDVRKGAGYFIYSHEKFKEATDEFHSLLEAAEDGDCTVPQYLKGLRTLIKKEPELIDAYAHLSIAQNNMGNHRAALTTAKKALRIALKLIPTDFKGQIGWGFFDNRPFLRAMESASMAYRRLGKHKEAARLLDTMLVYNPKDEVKFMKVLGSDLLRSGDTERAVKHFKKYADDFSCLHYELALAYLIDEDWINAATHLRKGFTGNIYIGEILNGNPHPLPLAIWHDDDENVHTALDYIEWYGALWDSEPEYLYFARWIFNHSTVMAERAEIMKCKEEMFLSRPKMQRYIIGSEQLLHIRQAINARETSELLKTIPDYKGLEIWPWEIPIFTILDSL